MRGAVVASAGLAGLAEAGLWFMPVRAVDEMLGGSLRPTLAHLALFVAAFAGIAAAGAASAWWGGVSPAILVLALVAGLAEGRVLTAAQPGAAIAAVFVTLAVGARVASLALRDWREPVQVAFGAGAGVLLAEVIGSGFAGSAGAPLLAATVPLFFLGSLASRAATARVAGETGPNHVRGTVLALAALGGALGLAASFGGAGGLFHRLGTLAGPIFGAVFFAVLWVVAQLARPLFWLADRFKLDVEGLRRALSRLGQSARDRAAEARPPESGMLERVLGLAFILLVALALLYAFRRLHGRRMIPREPGPDRVAVTAVESRGLAPAEGSASGSRRGLRRRVPADQVRRWYAEALLELERLRVRRRASATPGEFGAEVSALFPAAGPPFGALTAAYERVRYGALSVDPGSLRALRDERERLRGTLRSLAPLPEPAEERSGSS
ncbi:MAG: DUF4129 domain-containing protein [Actinobacteria bacterium]|nr:DUF4129 domain-containing protein [Actinomycetota bacterium]